MRPTPHEHRKAPSGSSSPQTDAALEDKERLAFKLLAVLSSRGQGQAAIRARLRAVGVDDDKLASNIAKASGVAVAASGGVLFARRLWRAIAGKRA